MFATLRGRLIGRRQSTTTVGTTIETTATTTKRSCLRPVVDVVRRRRRSSRIRAERHHFRSLSSTTNAEEVKAAKTLVRIALRPITQESPPGGELCETLRHSTQSNWRQSNNVVSICGRSEVASDVIYGGSLEATGDYLVVSFEVVCSNSFCRSTKL